MSVSFACIDDRNATVDVKHLDEISSEPRTVKSHCFADMDAASKRIRPDTPGLILGLFQENKSQIWDSFLVNYFLILLYV